MKKAVISVGGLQHLVAEGDELVTNKLASDKSSVDFVPLMIVDGASSVVDASKLGSSKVSAKVLEQELKGDKVTSIRYKSKKRVNTKRGHRQSLTKLKITSIN